MKNVERKEDQEEFITFIMEPVTDEGKRAYMCMEKKQYDRVMPPPINLSVRVVTEGSRDERCYEDGHVWDLEIWEEVIPDWPYLVAGECLVCNAVGHKGITPEEVARVPALRAKAQEVK